MVEMLGVLAIIGVLSVGAIAGYQKAMLKYKLNKQTEQIGSILDYVHLHLDDLIRAKEHISGAAIVPLLTKLGAIPKEMISPSNSYTLHDIFKNSINSYWGGTYYELIVNINNGQKESCLNLFQIAKERSSIIWRTKFRYSSTDSSLDNNFIYGDKHCTSSRKCLQNLSLSEAEKVCNTCDEEDENKDVCRFYFQI